MANEQFMDDQVLVQRYINGDEQSLEILLLRHKKRIFSYLMQLVKKRELAEDLFQDTFFKVINTLKKGNYNEEGKFLPWVLRIAHNLTVDYFRKDNQIKYITTIKNSKKSEDDESDILSHINIKEPSMEQNMVKKQVLDDIKYLVSQLPSEQKEVVMMRHYFDMSFKEISEQTNVSINTALGRMRYALINLRKMAEDNKISLYL
jgi:RNA polymerase sigma-70 factor (ECF subfamily)